MVREKVINVKKEGGYQLLFALFASGYYFSKSVIYYGFAEYLMETIYYFTNQEQITTETPLLLQTQKPAAHRPSFLFTIAKKVVFKNLLFFFFDKLFGVV